MQCQDQCLAQASPDAFEASDALLECIVDNGCVDATCVEDDCAIESFACHAGDGTCLGLTTCLEQCRGIEACQAACRYESSPLAQAQLEQLNTCDDDNNCGGDEACLLEFCYEQQISCVGGNTDGLSCILLVTCLIECNYDDLCALGCAPPISPEAQLEADVLGECAELAQCDTFNCTAELCANQWGVCVSGQDNCDEIYFCIESCQGSPICETNCLHEGSFSEQFVLFDLDACIANNNCEDHDCIEANCGPEVLACGL